MNTNIQDNLRCFTLDEFPIPDNYGDGFLFKVDDEEYITKGVYDYPNKEYREIRLVISTFGVQHYYASINIHVRNVNVEHPERSIFGCYCEKVIPNNYQDLRFELTRKVTQEEKENYPNRWVGYDVGDDTDAFYNEDDIISLFKEILPNMLVGKWCVCIRSCNMKHFDDILVEY